ncbi:CocE/NonD family hydrolase [Billgrantia lactosivorans]|uniref:CocE/NonD family hydrolase n=1 Tax=Billgrantia lactosivorans TaxID=2185141 RepID=UPI0013A6ABF1|nr:CocE/NonD family hydrolase [Halomonas lactosivorans]
MKSLLSIIVMTCLFMLLTSDTDPQPFREYLVPMRDGVRLQTRVWLPEGAAPGIQYPTVLTRGYRAGHSGDAVAFTSAGYVYVGQAARGHPPSEGELNRFFHDAEDGYDTLSWLSHQDWSDGAIAMYGRSYWGATQWLVAPEQHPNLRAIIPQAINADLWQCVYRCYGALTLAMTAAGRAYTDPEQGRRYGWEALYRYLPLIDLDLEVSGRRDRLWRDYVSHATFDDYWKKISLKGKYDRVRIPVYLMSGWYDYYAGAVFDNYLALQESGHDADLRLVINPSDHLNRLVGDREFGTSAEKNELSLAIRWLDHVVKGIENGVETEPPIRIFTMGSNEWQFANEWPLAGTRFTPFYFHSPDGARIGTLETSPPQDGKPTVYLYDPENPVPTLGGNHSFLGGKHDASLRAGSVDQRPNEGRPDVLVYTSPPVEQPLEVTGPITIVLYAASSARDTDFTAKLIDVHPDGTAFNLTEGIIRARFRHSIWEAPKLLTPGDIQRYELRLQPTSNVFQPGHRIQVHLSSSNFPLWDRNPNTGNPQGQDAELMVARQTIYHDNQHPSHIVLPLITH